MEVNGTILAIGVLLIIFSYFVGVKKQTWLLSGFNQHRVRDKEKLSKMVGTTDLLTGAFLIVSSFFVSQDLMILAIMLAAFAHVGIVVYANAKLVDK